MKIPVRKTMTRLMLMLMVFLMAGAPLFAESRTSPNLPQAQVRDISKGMVVYGAMLAAAGIAFGSVALVQNTMGNNNWGEFGKLSLGFSLGGSVFILAGVLTTTPFSQKPVFQEPDF